VEGPIEVFLRETADDTPPDCHQHCTHYESDGECCECGATKPVEVPLKEFFKQHFNDEEDMNPAM
jgi:hypothetical protein